jgi:hypothetical protein
MRKVRGQNLPATTRSRSAGKVTREERVTAGAAAALRMDGYSFSEIAGVLGLDTSTEAKMEVHKYLALACDELEVHNREALRRREDARLDKLLYAIWAKALDEEHPEQLYAVKVALAIAERRARMHGLDMPTEVVVHNPTQAEIDNWVASVAGVAAQHGVTEAEIIDAEIVEETL